MRLKELELQGYKTFAGKTSFVFTGGLTAIIGPNGSGKSNIADAIQWVLGEQNFSVLRAKRGEDMIFSGSNERARLGMAQASLTLDNTDGWLPIDYGEVVIARRTYRSGENEYYINGSRVRLRDITDMLAASGLGKRTYTVIGQGLIDQALSLRPDERRSLIEEAAGITGHQAKRNRALRQLEETHHNLERVQDILQEITPRLRYLRRQAERAEERLHVQADLDGLLRIWYGYRWHRALRTLDETSSREDEARTIAEARRKTLQHLAEAEEQLRQGHTDLRNQLGDWHLQSSQLHRQAEAVHRELAVGSERLRQLSQRRDELRQELAPLQTRLEGQAQQVQSTMSAVKSARESVLAAQNEIEEAQAKVDSLQGERHRRQGDLQRATARLASLEDKLGGQERSALEQEGRRHTLAEEVTRLQGELAATERRQAELTPQLVAHQEQLHALTTQRQELNDRRQAFLTDQARLEQELSRHAERLTAQQRVVDRLQDQLELLKRLKEEGEGYSGGARSIIRAVSAPRSTLSGILGTVADQIQVPAELELAIETALGGRLQDVIVERWQDAEAAIDWLKRHNGGRATFLPLDTIRPGGRAVVAKGPGVIGLAADLVSADRRLATLVEYLLGRVVITQDLATARRVLDQGQERPTMVTLEGDIVRPGGSVSGGSTSQRRDQGVLARERALRELPAQLARAQENVQTTVQSQEGLRASLEEGLAELAGLDSDLTALARREQGERAGLANMEGQAAQLVQEIQARRERLAAARHEQNTVEQRLAQAGQQVQELANLIQEAQQAVAQAEETLAGLDAAPLIAAVMERRSAAEVLAARLASQEALLANQQRTLTQLEREANAKESRAAAFAQEVEALQAQLQETQAQEGLLSAQIERYTGLIEPAEAELVTMETERNRLIQEQHENRKQLEHEEQAHHATMLALQRSQDEVEHLRSEIDHDVGLVELEHGENMQDQPPLPLRPLVERLPVMEALPEGTEQNIRQLRLQLSRLGSVNPNAPEEYAAALERHEFLTTQANDLEQAATSLEAIIQELDEVMQREFMLTFRAVAREFRDRFTQLFGGGTARLELSEPDNPLTSGIEIVVRPPGKRDQPLPLLSGGERSLTAAALVLSILKISPPPFCILDEVDAALDEANVDRFRSALREAARDIQFVIITHNRGTIEAADTIYGISMGSDSTSQMLSLHLEDRDGRRELVAD